MTRRQFTCLLAAPLAASQSSPSRKPNVIFMLADDLGAWAVQPGGCDGMVTPNLQRLAQSGVRFTNAFAATPVCSPSRATYLTGKLPSHHGIQDYLLRQASIGDSPVRYLADQLSFSEVFAQNGYAVGMSGKWHLGDDATPQEGFEYWATVLGSGGTYKDAVFHKNGETVPTKGSKTDAVGDFALEFIEQNKQRPFCLYMPFFAPHAPYDYQTEADRAPYVDADLRCFPDLPRHPRQMSVLNGVETSLGREHPRGDRVGYAALVTGMDRNIGRVLDKLAELGLSDNTVVVFTADQGFHCGHKGIWGKGNGTVPLNMYERSIRVPMIWSHPGRIPAGRQVTEMVSAYNFFPSILNYAGLDAPPDPERVGRSYVPLLNGQSWDRPEELYFEYSYVRSLRTPRYKLVLRPDDFESELFDLENDPEEDLNVIDDPALASVRSRLERSLGRFFEKIEAPPIDRWRESTTQDLPTYGARQLAAP